MAILLTNGNRGNGGIHLPPVLTGLADPFDPENVRRQVDQHLGSDVRGESVALCAEINHILGYSAIQLANPNP